MKTLKVLFACFLILATTAVFLPSIASADYGYWIIAAHDLEGIVDGVKNTELTAVALIATATDIKSSPDGKTIQLSGMWGAVYEAPWLEVLEKLTGASGLNDVLEEMCIPCGASPILPSALTTPDLEDAIRIILPGTLTVRVTTNLNQLKIFGVARAFGEYIPTGEQAMLSVSATAPLYVVDPELPPFINYDEGRNGNEIRIIPVGKL